MTPFHKFPRSRYGVLFAHIGIAIERTWESTTGSLDERSTCCSIGDMANRRRHWTWRFRPQPLPEIRDDMSAEDWRYQPVAHISMRLLRATLSAGRVSGRHLLRA